MHALTLRMWGKIKQPDDQRRRCKHKQERSSDQSLSRVGINTLSDSPKTLLRFITNSWERAERKTRKSSSPMVLNWLDCLCIGHQERRLFCKGLWERWRGIQLQQNQTDNQQRIWARSYLEEMRDEWGNTVETNRSYEVEIDKCPIGGAVFL